jgi:hypothetical protein
VRCVAGNVVETSINQSDAGKEDRGRCVHLPGRHCRVTCSVLFLLN